MELKHTITIKITGRAAPSNCTNMELKLDRPVSCFVARYSSNCTNMELKLRFSWIWNKIRDASNCTNMELKQAQY